MYGCIDTKKCDSKSLELDENMLDNRADDSTTINTDVVLFRFCPQHLPSSISHTLISKPAVIHQDSEYDLIVDLLNDLRPCAIRVQRTVMPDGFTLLSQQPTLSPRPAPLPDITPKTKVPSFATRRAACTHLTMDRLYGDYACNVCSRYPSLGWVYCCTQDEVPETPITPNSISEPSSPSQHVNDSGDEANIVNDPSMSPPAANEDCRSAEESILMPTAQLSPWVDKAIQDGHYTPEQIVKLRAQKQHVVDTAKAAVHQFEQSQTNNTNHSPQTPTTLQPIDMSSQLPFPVINEALKPAVTNLPSAKVASARQTNSRMFPFCKFCACHVCRPNHRERTWQHFDDIFESDYDIPFIHYEDRNRPLASRSIMSTIGLRPPRVPQHPQLRSADSTALYSRNEAGQIFFNNNANDTDSYRDSADITRPSSTDIADTTTEAESKGFRESMKRAFKGMILARQASSPGSRSSSSTNRKRKARDGTDTTEEDAVEFDMGLWKELNDELLKEASGVPLPGKDSIERLSKDVAGMGMGVGAVGGVAVTEEAADLGTADVIMSV